MAKVTVNVERYKGEYLLDPDVPLTGLDWRWIKKIAGYMPLTVHEGFEGDDPDLFIALTVVAMHRAGKIRTAEALIAAEILLDAPVDGEAIVFDFSDEQEQKTATATPADEEYTEPGEPQAPTI